MNEFKKLSKTEAEEFDGKTVARGGFLGLRGMAKEIATLHRETKELGAGKAWENSLLRCKQSRIKNVKLFSVSTALTAGSWLVSNNPAVGLISLCCGGIAIAEEVLVNEARKIEARRSLENGKNNKSQGRE